MLHLSVKIRFKTINVIVTKLKCCCCVNNWSAYIALPEYLYYTGHAKKLTENPYIGDAKNDKLTNCPHSPHIT